MSTSTQLSARNGTDLALRLAPAEWTREYLDTIKAVFGKGCTDAEFALAVQVSKQTGLRIDTRELWVYKRSDKDPMCLSISIDGFRAIAHASGTYAGEEGPLYCGKDGVWQEVWTGEGLPHAAKFSVWRTDFTRPFTAVILMTEFQRLGGFLWQKAPVWMGGIRAASHAYRKAYRQEIAGREMDAQALGASLSVGEEYGAAAVDAEPDRPMVAQVDEAQVIVDPATGEILSSEQAASAAVDDRDGEDGPSLLEPTPQEQERIAALERYEAAHDALTGRGITPRGGKEGKLIAYPRSVPASVPTAAIEAAIAKFHADYQARFGQEDAQKD